MMRIPLIAIILVALLTFPASIAAQSSDEAATLRPVTSSYTISCGSAHQANTYISPLKYGGWSVMLGYQRWQAMKFDPKKWVMHLTFDLDIDKTENPARNATMWYGGIRASWAMNYRCNITHALTLGAGPGTAIDLGCLYNARNGNNPAAAKAAWMVTAEAYATYKLRIGNLPITLGYNARVPITGAFFSPQYGELYYEIYLGDHSGLAHWGWWGNYFAIIHQLSADLHLGATALRIGFGMDYETTSVNHIVTRNSRYVATIGISGEWLSINPKRKSTLDYSIISAY